MSEFRIFFELGLEHILDYKEGIDHILFVVAICAVYLAKDWKRIIILVTAFTIGHSITLALATLNIIRVNAELIEFLIPLTIMLTCISNFYRREHEIVTRKIHINYILALFFGLIHGLGFSSYLRSLLGKDQSIVSQLFAFNVGLEAGQLVIVAIFLVVSFIFVDLFGIARRDWRIAISAAAGGIAFMLMMAAKYW